MNKVESPNLTLKERLSLVIKGKLPLKALTTVIRPIGDRAESGLEYMDVDSIWNAIKAAEDGHIEDLYAIYRDFMANDNHLQAEFAKRKIALLGDPLSIQEKDENSADDKTAAKAIEEMLSHLNGKERIFAHLLDSTLWPVSILEKVYRPSREPSLNYEIAELVPVEHDLQDFTTGKLMIRDTDPDTGRRLQTFHAPDPMRYIIHRNHILSLPDNWGGPMRSILFWGFLSTQDRTWWANFLDKYGSPFPVGKYDQNDDASRSVLMQAFSAAKKLGGLVVSKETEVELVEAAKGDAGDAYEKFHTICQREKSKLIIGQTLSAEAQSTGLGSSVGKGQENVRQDIRQFDSVLLAATLRDQLFKQYLQINGVKGGCPSATWGSDSSDELSTVGTLLKSLKDSGLIITDDGLVTLNKRLGFTVERDIATPPKAEAPLKQLRALSADPDELIVLDATADITQAFRSSLAPVRQLVLNSESPEELEQSIRTLYSEWKSGKVETLVADALTAFAANGATSQPTA